MAYLIAVAGLAGVGKTTAVDFLSEMSGGKAVYLGAAVLSEIDSLGLPQTPENERSIRLKLREQKGPAALAELAIDQIVQALRNGTPVLVDAIFVRQELDLLLSSISAFQMCLLGITASTGTRSARLASRPHRPLTQSQMDKRDRTEIEVMKIGEVLSAANHSIVNDGTRDQFFTELRALQQAVSSGNSSKL